MRRLLAGLFVVLAACGGPNIPKPPASGERLDVRFGSHVVRAEIADQKAEWAYGLMNRRRLGHDAGMLFVFPKLLPATAGFYMFRTLIPLQIAYMRSLGNGAYEVVAIRDMTPCRSSDEQKCPTYDPGSPYDAALEVNAGWLDRADVETGERATTRPSSS